MKKMILRTLAIVFSVLVAAALFTACGFPVSGEYSYANADAYTAGSGSVSAEGVNAVSVDWIGGGIYVSYSDNADGKITFSEETNETDEDYLLYSAVIGGELKIKFQKSGTRNKNNFSKNLNIKIPYGMALGSLDIDSVSGVISINPVSAAEIEVATVSGDIVALFPEANDLSLETVSGDIFVSVNGACSAELESVSGNVQIETETVGFRVSYDTVSGNVNNRCGALKNGKVYTYGGEEFFARVDTVSGDLTLNFTRPASPDV